MISQLAHLTRARRAAEAAYAVAANAYIDYEDLATTVAHEYFQAEAAFPTAMFRSKFQDADYAITTLSQLFERLGIDAKKALAAARLLESDPEIITKDFVDRGEHTDVLSLRKADALLGGVGRVVHIPRVLPHAASGVNFLTQEAHDAVEHNYMSWNSKVIPAVPDSFKKADRPHGTGPSDARSSLSGGKSLLDPLSLYSYSLLTWPIASFGLATALAFAFSPLSSGNSSSIPDVLPRHLGRDGYG